VAFADQSNGQGLEVWTSPDAETWTKSEIPLPEVAAPFRSPTYYSIHVIEGRYFIPTNNGMLVSEDGVSYTVAADTGANEQFTDIAYGGGVFMVGGFRGNINDEGPIFLNSRDGDTWTTDPLSVLAVEGQPADATVVPGGAVSMSVAATQPATAYQWYHDGNPVAGAVDSTLLLLDADQADAGSYQVDIVGVHGVTRSAPGMVEVANLELASGQYPGRLVNLSVLAHAGSGDNTLIAGFAVAGGQSGEDLNLLLRGLGPTLVPFDVAGALVNPHLELFGNSQTLGENDDWGGNSALIETSARLGATPFVDGDSADAALQTTAVGGAYTVHLVGVDEEGRGLAEVYDASLEEERGGETPRLTNLSTRVSMAEDGSPLIVGFVLRGASTQTVLLRAVGPGLTQFDVEGVLANPRLKLFRGEQQVLVTSTGAETITAQAAAAHVGAFALPDDSADAVAIVTLEAGVYTVHVESADSVPSPGSVVLVELYTID
jgi:hypothetical protein